MEKINGIQISGEEGMIIKGKRTVGYFKNKVELTIDTDKSSYIIKEKDILNFLKEK